MIDTFEVIPIQGPFPFGVWEHGDCIAGFDAEEDAKMFVEAKVQELADQQEEAQLHREYTPHYFNDDDRDPEFDEDHDPIFDDDDYEMLIECDTCDGDGFMQGNGFKIDCPDCGGEGWV